MCQQYGVPHLHAEHHCHPELCPFFPYYRPDATSSLYHLHSWKVILKHSPVTSTILLITGHQVLKEPSTAHQEEPGSEPGLWDVQTHAVP